MLVMTSTRCIYPYLMAALSHANLALEIAQWLPEPLTDESFRLACAFPTMQSIVHRYGPMEAWDTSQVTMFVFVPPDAPVRRWDTTSARVMDHWMANACLPWIPCCCALHVQQMGKLVCTTVYIPKDHSTQWVWRTFARL